MESAGNGEGVSAGVPSWRIKAPSSSEGSWRRRDSGYEGTGSRSPSPTLSHSSSNSSLYASRNKCPSSWSCNRCREYDVLYGTYKTRERDVRRWLCEQRGTSRSESELDSIDTGTLMRFATSVAKATPMPSSIQLSLIETIECRKEALSGWHWETRDHECSECGRYWSQADEGHKHHIREMERLLDMFEEVKEKPRVDVMALKSWR